MNESIAEEAPDAMWQQEGAWVYLSLNYMSLKQIRGRSLIPVAYQVVQSLLDGFYGYVTISYV